MAVACLDAARFEVPPQPRPFARRPRLVAALARADAAVLVLVSAPAGMGKTSLVAEWVRESLDAATTGWVDFEDADDDLWDPVLTCLGGLGVEVAAAQLGRAAGGSLGRRRLEELAGALEAMPARLTLVVDGYEMSRADIADEVDFLVQHARGRLRLVLVGRVDPVLPLYRYRLADALVEVRAADLAFTDDEAGDLLRLMDVGLGTDAVHGLNACTSGWVVGLRLAARTLVGSAEPEAAAEHVVEQAGDINEYLVGEVLDVQTPQVRRFLLDTSVADVLCPGLVEAVAGGGAERTLGELARMNAFVEPVPEQPGTYRYYPFFRTLLRARLAYESPERSVEIRHRAAGWFRGQGDTGCALQHLADVEAWEDIARLLVDDALVGRLVLEGSEGRLHTLLSRLPADMDLGPWSVVRAAGLLATGDRGGCAAELSRARRALRAGATPSFALAMALRVVDAARGVVADDADAALRRAEDAVRAVAAWPVWLPRHGRAPMQALVDFSAGVAMLRHGRLTRARTALAAATGVAETLGCPRFRADCLAYLAVAEALEGSLVQAGAAATECAAESEAAGSATQARATAEVALAFVALEQYRLPTAAAHLSAAEESRALTASDPVWRVLAVTVEAGLERARGRPREAQQRLERAADAAAPTDPWLAGRLHVEQARMSVTEGQADAALSALGGLALDDDPEAAAVAAAAWTEQGHLAGAEVSPGRAGATGGVVGTADGPLRARVSGLLVEAVAEARRRSPERARVVLNRALRLSAPEGLRRPFFEAGPAVRRALSVEQRLIQENRWLGAVGAPGPAHQAGAARPGGDRVGGDRVGAHEDRGRSVHGTDVVEPLTVKELEVLGHLEEMLTTEEIAEAMFVSVNTVRTHVRSILRKLGVSRRNAAVRRARQLGIVDGVVVSSIGG